MRDRPPNLPCRDKQQTLMAQSWSVLSVLAWQNVVLEIDGPMRVRGGASSTTPVLQLLRRRVPSGWQSEGACALLRPTCHARYTQLYLGKRRREVRLTIRGCTQRRTPPASATGRNGRATESFWKPKPTAAPLRHEGLASTTLTDP